MSNQEILEYIKQSFNLKTQGFYKPAIEMLYKALNISPDNIEILEQLAHLYKLLGESDRAIYYIEKVLEINANHIDALQLLQEIYMEKNEMDKAFETSEKICSISPQNSNFAKKIQILKNIKEPSAIYDFFQTIENPDENILYEVACVYFDKGDMKNAKELLQKAYEINSSNQEVSKLLAFVYYNENDTSNAEKILKKLSNKTEDSEIFNYLGLIAMNYDDNEKAISYFTKAHKLNEQNAEFIYNLASAYFMSGWLDEAAISFRKAICLAPMNVEYHYSLAYLYYQQKNYTAASGEVEAIKDINPEHQMTKTLHSMILAKQGDLLIAKQNLDELKRQNLEDDFVYYASFNINKDLLNIDVAKSDLEHAIELKPKSLNYLSDYLDFILSRKDYKTALEISSRILNINKNYLPAHIALAEIYMENKDYSKMYDEAQLIIELDSNCPNGYYFNSIALFKQGDCNFAIESLKKAISLDLNNALLYIKMSEFYQDTNDLDSAYKWALEAAEIDERNYNYRWLCAKIARALHRNDDALLNYSHCYRFASADKDLCLDYADFLKSVGRDDQAKRVLTKI